MDPLAATLGALALSSWLISYYISRPPSLRTVTSSSSQLALPSLLISELESARTRVASLLPFAVDLVASHELTRAGSRALGNADPGILPLATLCKALDKKLTSLDTIHFNSSASLGCREDELTAALINFSGMAELDTLLTKVIDAHPLRLDPKLILSAQRDIANAEVAVYTAATLDKIDFDQALVAHMAAAGSAPGGSNSLALPVLASKSTEIAIRASLWIYVIGFAMKMEAEGSGCKGFSKEFNQIAEEQRNALRELGLAVK